MGSSLLLVASEPHDLGEVLSQLLSLSKLNEGLDETRDSYELFQLLI